jgi:outer membrane protein OmpA-like peptidoglycan-associated protein
VDRKTLIRSLITSASDAGTQSRRRAWMSSAIHITLFDMSGAPLSPDVAKQLEQLAEKLAKKEKLTLNVEKT